MKLVKPSIKFLNCTENALQAIEIAGRTCYKSEDKITEDSAGKFVKMLIVRGHEAMIEHANASYKIVCDRGVTHEIVRHRLFSYAQESTRFCNYKGGVTFIIPPWIGIPAGDYLDSKQPKGIDEQEFAWWDQLMLSEISYKYLLDHCWTPQQARSVLPNSLKTEIVVTGNLREWRHFFKLRCSTKAHPQMQEIANMIFTDIRERIAVVFDELDFS